MLTTPIAMFAPASKGAATVTPPAYAAVGRIAGGCGECRGVHRRLVTAVSIAAVASGCLTVPVLAASPSGLSGEDLTTLVNPLAGSLGPGFVTVGAQVPFGMVTPGPATTTPHGDDPVNYTGYGWQDPSIRGFPVVHFSGAGVHMGGELPTMPTTGPVDSADPMRWSSPYSHAQETARPGYYAVTLDRYQTRVELTATTHVAVERLTFPPTAQANVLFDVTRDNDGAANNTLQTGVLHVVDNRTVTGSVLVPGHGGVTMWFVARFDRPFTTFGTWLGTTLTPGGTGATGAGAGGWVSFDTTTNRVVGVRVALSYVDAHGAAGNLATEAPDGTTFAAVRQRAHDRWNRRLHAIEVTGGFGQQRATFYTNLYHALLMPTTFDDADGRYLGFDDAAHDVAPGAHHYSDLSLWDTYRTQTPLLTLAAPDVAHDLGVSLLDDTDQNGGVIPRWVRANRDYAIMGGDSGTATLAALVTDGALAGGDALRAFHDVVRQATTLPPVSPRADLDAYLAHGYVPNDVSDRGAALTLEYAVDDASVAALAARFGATEQVGEFTRRAGFWRNLLEPRSHFLRPRNSDGSWAKPTPPGVWSPDFQDGWQEGTGWQYLWLVPQDVAGLVEAIGPARALRRLDRFFDARAQSEAAPAVPVAQMQASLFGVYYAGNQFTPANETDLQAPWLFDWVGQPWKTQRVVHAEAQVWSALPYGLPGNDDAGAMSAWYVLAAVGLYQAQPGFDAWELSSPLFSSVVVRGDGTGRPRLTITAAGAGPADEYVAAATLSGRPLTRDWLTVNQVGSGRALALTLRPTPSRWATGPDAAPPSLSGWGAFSGRRDRR